MSIPVSFCKDKLLIMGILNYTPDSFSDGGLFNTPESAVKHTLEMIKDGADIIDLGACSTRPGAVYISESEELELLKTILPLIRKQTDIPLSVDTFYPRNMLACADMGADIINDVGGVFGDENIRVIKEYGVYYIVMHGGVNSGKRSGEYPGGVVNDIKSFFSDCIHKAADNGIENKIILDPGFGFNKSTEENAVVLNRFEEFGVFGQPLLAGLSRKRFIGALSLGDDKNDRLGGTLAADLLCMEKGASVIRVHDILNHRRAVDFICNLNNYR